MRQIMTAGVALTAAAFSTLGQVTLLDQQRYVAAGHDGLEIERADASGFLPFDAMVDHHPDWEHEVPPSGRAHQTSSVTNTGFRAVGRSISGGGAVSTGYGVSFFEVRFEVTSAMQAQLWGQLEGTIRVDWEYDPDYHFWSGDFQTDVVLRREGGPTIFSHEVGGTPVSSHDDRFVPLGDASNPILLDLDPGVYVFTARAISMGIPQNLFDDQGYPGFDLTLVVPAPASAGLLIGSLGLAGSRRRR